MSVDLPTLGKPSRPTSASSLSSRRTVRSSPGVPGSALRGARSVDVAKWMLPRPPLPPWATTQRSPCVAQIADQLAGRVVEHLRAGRDAQHDVLAAAPYLSLWRPCSPAARAYSLPVAEVEQRRQPLVDDEDDAAAVAAVAARRARPGDELLAPERDRAVAAVAGLHADRRFVDEVHGGSAALRAAEPARRRPALRGRGADDAGDRARAGRARTSPCRRRARRA